MIGVALEGKQAEGMERNEMALELQKVETALVMGGGRGIGRETVVALSKAGTRTALVYRSDEESAKITADLAEKFGPRPLLLRGDVGSETVPLVERTLEHFDGELGLIVHTCYPDAIGRVAEIDHAKFRSAYDTMVWSVQEATLTARSALSESAGPVVAVSSLGAWRYAKYYGALGPAKAALESLVRYLAAELGRDGIRVNAVSPGMVDNSEQLGFAAKHGKDRDYDPEAILALRAPALKRTPLRRLATPVEIAQVIVALGSPSFSCVTGETVRVDCGHDLLG